MAAQDIAWRGRMRVTERYTMPVPDIASRARRRIAYQATATTTQLEKVSVCDYAATVLVVAPPPFSTGAASAVPRFQYS
eukprot:1081768-Rhodomonas_salina.3